MPEPIGAKPSGIAYLLARLKGLWAAVYPLYELYQAVNADQTITAQELEEIGQALVVFGGVWLIPNLGYVRRLRDRYGRPVAQGVDDSVTAKLPESAVLDTDPDYHGRHEDRDNDGVPDHIELQANEFRQERPGATRVNRLRNEDRP